MPAIQSILGFFSILPRRIITGIVIGCLIFDAKWTSANCLTDSSYTPLKNGFLESALTLAGSEIVPSLTDIGIKERQREVEIFSQESRQRKTSPISKPTILEAVQRILDRGGKPTKQLVAAELNTTAHNLQEWFRRYSVDMQELGLVTGKAIALSEITNVVARIIEEGGRPTRSAVASRVMFRGKAIQPIALVKRIKDLGHTLEQIGIVSEELVTEQGILLAAQTIRKAGRRPTDRAVMRQMGVKNSTFYRSIKRQKFDLSALGVLEKDTFRHHMRNFSRSAAAARDRALAMMDHWELTAVNSLRLDIQTLFSSLRTERRTTLRSTWKPRLDRVLRRLRLAVDLTDVPMLVKRGNLFLIIQLLDYAAGALSTPIGQKPRSSPSLKDALERLLKDIQEVVSQTKNRKDAAAQLDRRLGMLFSKPDHLSRFLYLYGITASWQEPRHDENQVQRLLKDTQSMAEALQLCESQMKWKLEAPGLRAYVRRHHIEVSWYKPNPSPKEVQALIKDTTSEEEARAVLTEKLGWQPGKNFNRYMEDHSLNASWYHARTIVQPTDDELFRGVLVRDIKAALAASTNSTSILSDLEHLGWKVSAAGLNYHLKRFGWEAPWHRKKPKKIEPESA